MLLKTETDIYKGAVGKWRETHLETELKNHRPKDRQLSNIPTPVLAKRTLGAWDLDAKDDDHDDNNDDSDANSTTMSALSTSVAYRLEQW